MFSIIIIIIDTSERNSSTTPKEMSLHSHSPFDGQDPQAMLVKMKTKAD